MSLGEVFLKCIEVGGCWAVLGFFVYAYFDHLKGCASHHKGGK